MRKTSPHDADQRCTNPPILVHQTANIGVPVHQSQKSQSNTGQNQESEWLGMEILVHLSCCKKRAVYKAVKRAFDEQKPWRGATLIVRQIDGVGGRSGKIYQVRADSLPAALQRALIHRCALTLRAEGMRILDAAAPAPCKTPRHDNTTIGMLAVAPDMGLAQWRYAMVAPALKYPAGSMARKAAIDAIVGNSYPKYNNPSKIISPSRATLYNWIKDAERGGVAGLARKPRADQAVSRTRITRKWDAVCPLGGCPRIERSTAKTTFF